MTFVFQYIVVFCATNFIIFRQREEVGCDLFCEGDVDLRDVRY